MSGSSSSHKKNYPDEAYTLNPYLYDTSCVNERLASGTIKSKKDRSKERRQMKKHIEALAKKAKGEAASNRS